MKYPPSLRQATQYDDSAGMASSSSASVTILPGSEKEIAEPFSIHSQPKGENYIVPISTPDSSSIVEETGDDRETSSPLPFSKARCIALVATVTGASFMNVSYIIFLLKIDRGLPFLLSCRNLRHHDKIAKNTGMIWQLSRVSLPYILILFFVELDTIHPS